MDYTVWMSVPKISKKFRSFSLPVAVFLLGAGVLTGSARAESIEVLYEHAEHDSWLVQLGWLLLAAGLVTGAVVWWTRHYYLQKLQQMAAALQQADSHLRDTQRIARIGTWSRNFSSGETYLSPAARSVLGLGDQNSDDGNVPHLESLIHPADRERVAEVMAAAYVRGGGYQCDHRIVCPDGHEKYVRLAGQVILGEGSDPVNEAGTVQDITCYRQVELALQRSEERMRAILDAAPFPILILEQAPDYPVMYANQSAYSSLGIDPLLLVDDLSSRAFWKTVVDREQFIKAVQDANQVHAMEMLMQTLAGRNFWATLSGSRLDFGGLDAVFISIMDISERKHGQQEPARLSSLDPHTGILNRRSFVDNAQRELRRAVRYQQKVAVLVLEFDQFKSLSARHGQHFCDSVLRRFCDLTRYQLREEDVLGRLNDETLVLLLVGADVQSTRHAADRIRTRWAREVVESADRRLGFTVSIGVALMEHNADGLDAMLERAGLALQQERLAAAGVVQPLASESGSG